jgi:hypothetical protein
VLPVPPPASRRLFASQILPIVMPRFAHFLKCSLMEMWPHWRAVCRTLKNRWRCATNSCYRPGTRLSGLARCTRPSTTRRHSLERPRIPCHRRVAACRRWVAVPSRRSMRRSGRRRQRIRPLTSDERNLFGKHSVNRRSFNHLKCSFVGLASMQRSRCLASSFSRTARRATGSFIVP